MVECLYALILWLLGWIVLLPLWLLVATPYVLVAVAFDSSAYGRAICSRYRGMCAKLGLGIDNSRCSREHGVLFAEQRLCDSDSCTGP